MKAREIFLLIAIFFYILGDRFQQDAFFAIAIFFGVVAIFI